VLADAEAGKAQAESVAAALPVLELAPSLGLTTPAYHTQRAALLDRGGRTIEADRERRLARELKPRSALDHFLAGEALYRAGQTEAASAEFDKALEPRPDHFWSRFSLSVCQLQLQHWEAARAGFSACLVQQPQFVWIYVFRSLANEKLRDFDAAEADLQQVLRLNPTSDARYIVLVNRGILHFEQKELDKAAQAFQEAVQVRPDQYNAHLNLARALVLQRKPRDAALEVDRALALRPPGRVVAAYHLERARTLFADHQYESAAEAVDTAVHFAPEEPTAYRLRACVLCRLQRYSEASRAIDDYFRYHGQPDTDIFRLRGQVRMASAAYTDAVEDYSRAIELHPAADLYLHRGWAYYFSDGWKLALRDFDRALQMDPSNADTYAGRGLACVMLGDYRQAVADAEEALRRKPLSPEMSHNIACIFAQALARVSSDSTAKDAAMLRPCYQRKALECVRRTLQMVPPQARAEFWNTKVLPDRALDPIRKCPEFQQIAAEAKLF